MAFAVPAFWVPRLSPNHNARHLPVRAIVLHADASANVEGTLSWLATPSSKVSYHVVVGRDGTVYMAVHPDRRAWHAGVSSLHGVADCNGYSVGVCLSNTNSGTDPYPSVQVAAVVGVCVALCQHYGIDPAEIVSHAAVALPPGRKTDPKGLDIAAFRAAVLADLLHGDAA